jgi:hypothetical protein
MNKTLALILVAVLCFSISFLIKHTEKKEVVKKAEHNGVTIMFNGKDRDIPVDGQLLLVKKTIGDTIIVEPASLDDCRRILEENGQG